MYAGMPSKRKNRKVHHRRPLRESSFNHQRSSWSFIHKVLVAFTVAVVVAPQAMKTKRTTDFGSALLCSWSYLDSSTILALVRSLSLPLYHVGLVFVVSFLCLCAPHSAFLSSIFRALIIFLRFFLCIMPPQQPRPPPRPPLGLRTPRRQDPKCRCQMMSTMMSASIRHSRKQSLAKIPS